jgi:hypothetical protein
MMVATASHVETLEVDRAGVANETDARAILTVPKQDPPTPYPDGYNPDLLERIPLHARTVLDVGCGGGACSERTVVSTRKRACSA